MSKTSVFMSSPVLPAGRTKQPVNLTDSDLTVFATAGGSHKCFKAANVAKHSQLHLAARCLGRLLPFTRAIFIPLPTLFLTLLISLKEAREEGQGTVVSDG